MTGREKSYSVLVCRTVLFWERVDDVQAETPDQAAELGLEEVEKSHQYDWSNSHEERVLVRVERNGEFVGEYLY